MAPRAKAGEYVDHLYDFLEQNQVQQKLLNYQQQFEQEGDLAKAREYAQIYRLVMDLLDQIYELLGEEEISLTGICGYFRGWFWRDHSRYDSCRMWIVLWWVIWSGPA